MNKVNPSSNRNSIVRIFSSILCAILFCAICAFGLSFNSEQTEIDESNIAYYSPIGIGNNSSDKPTHNSTQTSKGFQNDSLTQAKEKRINQKLPSNLNEPKYKDSSSPSAVHTNYQVSHPENSTELESDGISNIRKYIFGLLLVLLIGWLSYLYYKR